MDMPRAKMQTKLPEQMQHELNHYNKKIGGFNSGPKTQNQKRDISIVNYNHEDILNERTPKNHRIGSSGFN